MPTSIPRSVIPYRDSPANARRICRDFTRSRVTTVNVQMKAKRGFPKFVRIFRAPRRIFQSRISRSKTQSEAGLSNTKSNKQRGFYDLTQARTQESGSITRVEEFGLSSVSEEVNVSDLERPASASPDSGKASANDASGRRSRQLRGNLRQKTVSSDDILESRTRLQPQPVSFSMDKLCSDAENDGATATAADAEASRDHGGKGGLIKRRMLGSIRGLMASTHLLQTYEIEEVLGALMSRYFSCRSPRYGDRRVCAAVTHLRRPNAVGRALRFVRERERENGRTRKMRDHEWE